MVVVPHFRVVTVGMRTTAARHGGMGRTGEKRDAAMGAMRKAGVWLRKAQRVFKKHDRSEVAFVEQALTSMALDLPERAAA